MNHKITKTLILLFAFSLLLSACGSSSKSKAEKIVSNLKAANKYTKSTNVPNPCDILKFSDIQAVMDQPMTSDNGEKGFYSDDLYNKKCSWRSNDLPFSSFEIVSFG